MEFSLWVNIQIKRFQTELSNICRTSRDYNYYRNKFVDYCVDCINEYDVRYELESILKRDIVSKHISLLREMKMYQYM